MRKWLYKKILRKIDLSRDQLTKLLNKLNTDNICTGPFLKGEKMCPNTTALSLKLGRTFNSNTEIDRLLKQAKVSKLELVLFYLFFDVPAAFSFKLFEKTLKELKTAIRELM
jgi:hypothetical protein